MGCPAHLLEFDSSVPSPEDRLRPPESVNLKLLERILRHRHFLLRAENGAVRDIVGPLRDVKRRVREEVTRILAREELSDFSELRVRSLRELERRLDRIIFIAQDETISVASRRFREIAEREAEIQSRLLQSVLPGELTFLVDVTRPDLQRVLRLLNQPLGGKRWADRMRENFGELTRVMKRDLATSVALGEGIGPAQRRLRRSVDKLGINRATTIARSEIQRTASQSAQAVYRRNASIIKAEQWVATLDERTCLICAPLDGETWALGESHPRPVDDTHANCRCFLSPVTRSFEELGLPFDEFSPSTRASMDGQVPAQLNYREWFNRQPESFQREVLGPGRFKRFSEGELSIDDFTRDQRILPLDSLPEMSLES